MEVGLEAYKVLVKKAEMFRLRWIVLIKVLVAAIGMILVEVIIEWFKTYEKFLLFGKNS